MASLPKLFSFFIIFISIIPTHSELDQLLYNGFKHTNLTINGVTKIQENGILRLTNETSRLMGHAFHPSPLRFKRANNSSSVFSFSTSFAFAIVPEYPKLGGHGLAFTISPSKQLKAHPSQYLGLLNASDMGNFSNHLFAVEFDTVQDFEFGDINDNHVGIDINSLVSNASANATYIDENGVKQGLLLKSGKTIQAWIDYDSVRKTINVTISPTSSKPKLPILSFDMDLSSILHEYMYVGFSASTGLLASSHYVFGWSFKMNGAADSFDLSKLASLPGPPKNKQHRDITIGAIISSIIFVIFTLSAAFYLVRKMKNADVIEPWELETGPHRYSYQELKKATKGFKEKELLGHGGFGRVYKGTLPNTKTQIAVKRISQQSKQGLREFVSEITTIGKLRHRNLVQLLGWCRCREDLLLVYEFMSNGSLEKLLFDQPEKILNWDERFKIIKGVASGLLYLHEGYEQVVIHRDVKASNVLLDGELNGKLGDFGLARLYEHGSNPGTTRVVGTLGYLAPELPRTGKANTASDVFAFGALLLEVVCGRRPIDPKAMPEELVLVDHVWDQWRQRRVLEVVDSKLANEYDENEVMMVLKLGIMCSNNSPSARPGMRLVVRYLEGEIVMPDVLRPPGGGYDDESQGGMDGFDDFVHSFDTASFDTNRYGASMSTSPLSLLNGRGDSSTGGTF